MSDVLGLDEVVPDRKLIAQAPKRRFAEIGCLYNVEIAIQADAASVCYDPLTGIGMGKLESTGRLHSPFTTATFP